MSNLARGSYTVRLHIPNKSGTLAQVTTLISDHGGSIGAIDIVRVEEEHLVRDITFDGVTPETSETLLNAMRKIPGVEVVIFLTASFSCTLAARSACSQKFQ